MADAQLPLRQNLPDTLRIAVLLPCYNEAAAIGETVAQFARALPTATIYVFDNNSSDGTGDVASVAGAVVRRVRQQGKGHVVRRMFADVDADIYVMADGDATYDAAAAPALIAAMLADNLDMVVGARKSEVESAYRRGHRLGNRVLTGLLRQLFGRSFTDILSGYRVFSRRFVKSFPVLSAGFEIETEMSVHALELRMPVGEIVTAYAARPEGSQSKLSTFRDGWRILRTMIQLYRVERPLWFYGYIGAFVGIIGVILGIPVIVTYLETHLVPRFPTVIAIVGLGILAALNFMTGLILDTVTRGRQEVKRLAYLAHRAPMPPPATAVRPSEVNDLSITP
ncbi:MAG TPA: glycosyltransferase family 2 protein [Sphingobium sp.]|nr:glycosyltransferase family 2 protein [Sphingobium sp.]